MTTSPTTLSLADQARTLLAASATGALATLDPRTGHPYASLVEMLPDDTGGAIFLISTLAAHTTNLGHDPRASLLVSDPLGQADPLAHARATLMGEVHKAADQGRWRAGFATLHPGSARVMEFGDFSFWQLHVLRVRFIAGFGQMGWLEHEDYTQGEPDLMAHASRGIIVHMNEDHQANMLDYAHAFAKVEWATGARMVGIDRHGFDLELLGDHPDSGRRVRIEFPAPLDQPGQARAQFVGMAQGARAILGERAHTGKTT